MLLYRITLVPLAKELIAADPGLLSLFYANDVVFYGSARQSAQLFKLLMERGYFPEPSKSLIILDTPGQEEAARGEFVAEGLVLNFVSGIRYLGAYLGPQEELVAWVKPQLEAWVHGVRALGKIAQRRPQLSYDGLGMSLQLDLQYMQTTIPGVGTLMGPIEEDLRETLISSPHYSGGGRSTPTFGKS